VLLNWTSGLAQGVLGWHEDLRLPTGAFYAQSVKANVLFFDRKPARENSSYAPFFAPLRLCARSSLLGRLLLAAIPLPAPDPGSLLPAFATIAADLDG
jgi:hypothetical protein